MFYQRLFTLKSLLEHGVHYGHRKNRWNPKMAQYIYGIKNKVHIIDLQQTAVMLDRALFAIKSVAARNGKILFVSTKKNSADVVAENAKKCGQYFVNKRWLGGMLSNWQTVSASVKKMEDCEKILAQENVVMKKKERLTLQRKFEKLDSVLGGIRTMGGLPDMLFVIDAHKHKSAIAEANNMGIEVVSVVDTNTDPSNVDYIIPGNDDARKSIELFMSLASAAALEGTIESLAAANAEFDENTDIATLKEMQTQQNRKPRTGNSRGVSRLKQSRKEPKGQA